MLSSFSQSRSHTYTRGHGNSQKAKRRVCVCAVVDRGPMIDRVREGGRVKGVAAHVSLIINDKQRRERARVRAYAEGYKCL